MARYWFIIDIDQEIKLEKEVYYKKWNNNIVVKAEAITLLELLEIIERKDRHIS